ncbi:mitochondrial ATP synthase epsilon chain domain-containing protein [Trichodelitschia bisporula]|uniref:Mitochondrial ATP synthase epsilon chain domain-containing protein n=1 Tax=Trichodelitschia bisporula TaxID=703511 RepID=A0A6G1HM41_9PEZI|nr:mitochondrial ATP synthase epsilon chain domain-containing protein [Trichodelitschia bisporula]
MAFAWKASGLTQAPPGCWLRYLGQRLPSYNRYLAVASRVVRRSLKEDLRVQAERRGEMDLRFAKWENGKQGENKNLAKANEVAMAEHTSSSQ